MSSQPRAQQPAGKSPIKDEASGAAPLKPSSPDGVWNAILRPLGGTIVASDTLFLSTTMQSQKDVVFPSLAFGSLALLCLGILVFGFWYALSELFRVARSGQLAGRTNGLLSVLWVTGAVISILGISGAIGLVNPIIGAGVLVVTVVFVLTACAIMLRVTTRPGGGSRDKAPAGD